MFSATVSPEERRLLVDGGDPAASAMRGELWGSLVRGEAALLRRAALPVTTFTSVDLPAPFSPTSAWISPLRSSKEAEAARGRR